MKKQDTILQSLVKTPLFNAIQNLIKKKQRINIKFLYGSLKSILIASLWQNNKNPYYIIVKDYKECQDWFNDLSLLIENDHLIMLQYPIKHIKNEIEQFDDSMNWLVEGISLLQKQPNSIIISTPQILDTLVPDTETIKKSFTSIHINQELPFEEFITTLALNGFDKKDFVSAQGDIAVRGGIVDIFPINWDNPIRLEFFGNTVESIREFQVLSQRSIRSHNSLEFISKIFSNDNVSYRHKVKELLDNKTIFIIDNLEEISIEHTNFQIPSDYQTITLNGLGKTDLKINSRVQTNFKSSIKLLLKEIIKLSDLNYKICFTADGKIQLNRFKDLIENAIEIINEEENLSLDTKLLENYIWLEQTFSNGFVSEDLKLAIITEHQTFNRLRSFQQQNRISKKGGFSLRELKMLHIGDYIVHEDKGIGRFDGFQTVQLGSSKQDCVKIIYDGGDILYVHLNYLHKLQKFNAEEGVQPKLSKLGQSDWLRKKERAKKRIKDIARDLIKLYAERKMQSGFAYPPDSIWQKEFEASFIYEDTLDQARTTDEIKKDLESLNPMDRLICGDVGFGKTEIAIRAAFKVAMSGKQTAVLVPTTILAQQHYLTFVDRLSRYPIIVEVISRFKSSAEQKKIIEKLINGQIDIIIGTHRLISNDIKFKDLGLLIIDEEHRFGVSAKEKLRQMKKNVDTLTLTATPIPRTLNFSLMGARDLSIIETPPRNRIPVYTEICEWKDKTIVDAINKEINRGGQVFFVTDKVIGIEKLLIHLQRLMPSVKFAIAHGQMSSSQLESVMIKFISRKIDVLITTKIIESGLDIPNTNTIFINNAQNFGLAELYQLRGRVGRSNIQAYCYLIVPPIKTLTNNTIRRLQAIEEFTELGSGFQLAMRDMEIRGAGNLLGAEQSGYINDIGFDLYQKILDDAVFELKNEEFTDIFDTKTLKQEEVFKNEDIAIEIESDAYLPTNYVQSETERFFYYKKLYNARTNEELKSIIEEIEDRFGKMPQKAKELIFAVKLRIAALGTGFVKITFKNNNFKAELPPDNNDLYYENAFPIIVEFIKEFKNSSIKEFQNKLIIEIPNLNRNQSIEVLWRLKKTLKTILFE